MLKSQIKSASSYSPSARFNAFSGLAKVAMVNHSGLQPAGMQTKQLFVGVKSA